MKPKNKIWKFLITLSVIVGLHSCASMYSVVEFEVLEPASIRFPEEVGQLMILNRAPFTLDVVHEGNRTDMTLEYMVVVDTAVTNAAFHGLLNILQQSPIQKFHTPFWLTERRGDTTSLKDLFLTKREVNNLCSQYGADAIISLEFYSFGIDDHYEFYEDNSDLEDVRYEDIRIHYHPASARTIWNIYLPDHPRPIDSYTIIDTLYFTAIMDGLPVPKPSPLDMIRELFYESGTKYGKYLVPVWTHTSRTLFRGKNDSLKLAAKLTNRGEWEQAYEIWEALTFHEDSSTASKAYNNMAIFYELEDNLDSASLLVNRALDFDTLGLVRNYREELDIRLENKREVIRQIR